MAATTASPSTSIDAGRVVTRALAAVRASWSSILATLLLVIWLPDVVVQSFVVWAPGPTTYWVAVVAIAFTGALGQLAIVSLALAPEGSSTPRAVGDSLAAFPTLLPVWLLGNANSFITTWLALARPPFPRAVVAAAIEISPWARFLVTVVLVSIIGLLSPIVLAERRFSFAAYRRAAALVRRVRVPYLGVFIALYAVLSLINFFDATQIGRMPNTNGRVLLSFLIELGPLLVSALWSVFEAQFYLEAAGVSSPSSIEEIFS